MLRSVRSRLRSLAAALLRRDRFEDRMADEMRFHLAAYADDLVHAGVPREEAERRARVEFGGVEGLKEECRQARGLRLFDELRQDLRYAWRLMRKTPGFSAAAILSIALGIGANTAIFSLMDAVLLKDVPVRNPQDLFFLAHGPGEYPSQSSNYPLLERYRSRLDVFDGITAYYVAEFKVSTPAGADLVWGQFVSGNYHGLLGVPFTFGRGFTSESDTPSDGSLVAVISDDYWARRFGRDPDVLGKTIDVQGHLITIVGVTAAGFDGLRPGTRFEITLPLSVMVIDRPEFPDMHDTWTGLNLVGRLKTGVTDVQALSGLDAHFKQYISEPDNQWAWTKASPADRAARLVPAGKGSGALRRNYSEPLRVLMAMVGVVLLIACCNVAALLLVRGSVRAKEVAVRMSVGAGRARLIRQFLTESTLIALCGGGLGLLLAMWGTASIVLLFRVGQNPILLDVSPNARVLAFTTVVSMLAGIAFGLVPSFRATRVDVTPALKANGGVATRSRRRPAVGRLLVVSQIALCMLTIAGAGLLVRSLHNLKTLPTGFQTENVLLSDLDTRGTTSSLVDLHAALLERLQALPGVRAASFCTTSPLSTDEEQRRVLIPDVTDPPALWNNLVTTDYFSTFDVKLVRGRGLTPQDSASARKVAVVSETMVRAYFGSVDPLGRSFAFGTAPDDPVTIVGVARDAYQRTLREPVPRLAYTPLVQAQEPKRHLTAAVRAEQDPRSLEPAVREAVRAISPDLVISYIRTMEQQLDATLVRERLLARLATGFAGLALLLACLGLYGVMSYDVTRRAREIAIRMALGAARSLVLRGVLRHALLLSIAGIVIGLGAAFTTTHVVSAFLFGVTERDPLTFGATAAILLATTLMASWLPARRAASVDPIAALKSE